MPWIAAAIFGVALIYFAIHHRGFRKLLGLIALALTAICIAGGGYFYWTAQREAARSAYAKTLIKTSEVDFFGLTLSSDGFHAVRGTVRNRSPYTLKAFRMKVTVQDCPAGKCDTIGQDEMWEYSANVPPSQVRTFEGYVNLVGMPPPVAQQWYYTVTELEADIR